MVRCQISNVIYTSESYFGNAVLVICYNITDRLTGEGQWKPVGCHVCLLQLYSAMLSCSINHSLAGHCNAGTAEPASDAHTADAAYAVTIENDILLQQLSVLRMRSAAATATNVPETKCYFYLDR